MQKSSQENFWTRDLSSNARRNDNGFIRKGYYLNKFRNKNKTSTSRTCTSNKRIDMKNIARYISKDRGSGRG